MGDFRRANMQGYRDAVPKGSIEWHLRTLELAATGTGGRTPSSTVRYHIRQIRRLLVEQDKPEKPPFGPDWVRRKVEENERGFGHKS